jgi:hypothetical protein
MAGPAIWYYPEPNGRLEKIDLSTVSGGLTDLSVAPIVARSDGISQTGARFPSVVHSKLRIVAQLLRFSGRSTAGQNLVSALIALIDHLGRGGICSLAAEEGSAWAGFARGNPRKGATVCYVTRELFGGALGVDPIPTAEDLIWIETLWPTQRRERLRVSAYVAGSGKITFSNALRYDHGPQPVFLHHRDFWTALRLPAEADPGAILTSDKRRTYSLILPLEQDPGVLNQLADLAASEWASTTSAAGQTFQSASGDQGDFIVTSHEPISQAQRRGR